MLIREEGKIIELNLIKLHAQPSVLPETYIPEDITIFISFSAHTAFPLLFRSDSSIPLARSDVRISQIAVTWPT